MDKKVVSEKQSEHLKKAREKALATRQAGAKVKKEEEEVKRLQREEKREEAYKLKVLKEDKEFELKKKNIHKPDPIYTHLSASIKELENECEKYKNHIKYLNEKIEFLDGMLEFARPRHVWTETEPLQSDTVIYQASIQESKFTKYFKIISNKFKRKEHSQ